MMVFQLDRFFQSILVEAITTSLDKFGILFQHLLHDLRWIEPLTPHFVRFHIQRIFNSVYLYGRFMSYWSQLRLLSDPLILGITAIWLHCYWRLFHLAFALLLWLYHESLFTSPALDSHRLYPRQLHSFYSMYLYSKEHHTKPIFHFQIMLPWDCKIWGNFDLWV